MIDWTTAARCDTQRYAALFLGLIERGVYLPCSQFEALFVSAAHSEADIDATLAAARNALHTIRRFTAEDAEDRRGRTETENSRSCCVDLLHKTWGGSYCYSVSLKNHPFVSSLRSSASSAVNLLVCLER